MKPRPTSMMPNTMKKKIGSTRAISRVTEPPRKERDSGAGRLLSPVRPGDGKRAFNRSFRIMDPFVIRQSASGRVAIQDQVRVNKLTKVRSRLVTCQTHAGW